MPKFRYYIVAPFEDNVVGTDDLEVAKQYECPGDVYVIDSVDGTELLDGNHLPIQNVQGAAKD